MTSATTAPLEKRANDDAPDVLPRGFAVGRYVVLDRIGTGAAGTVYAAFDGHLGRRVALKLMHRTQPTTDDVSGPHSVHRWSAVVREARALAQLDHPNVVTVHDVGVDAERAYIAMEFVDGIDLSQWLRQAGTRSWRDRIAPFIAAGAGLDAAHSQGVIHGDFKPANVLHGIDGRVRVSDFGVALYEGSGDESPSAASDGSRGARTGECWGTPLYMAPELFAGGRPNAASDVYSFCATLFEALYGYLPASGDDVETLHRAKSTLPQVGHETSVPKKVRDLVLAGLHPNPQTRPSLKQLLGKLTAVSRSRAGRVVAWLAAPVVVLGAAAWAGAFSPEACTGAVRHLQGVWDDAARSQVAGALVATGLPETGDIDGRVQTALDAYAAEWVAAHSRVCLATHLGEQSSSLLDEKMTCLQGRLGELAALVDVLGAADKAVATRAVAAAGGLTPLSRCEDVGHLQQAAWQPAAHQVQLYEASLAAASRAQALSAVGKYAEGLEAAQANLVAAQELEATPLIDHARYLVGWLMSNSGAYADAAETLTEAALTAVVHKHDDIAARASVLLVRVLGARLGRLAEAETWAKHAAALVDRADLGPRSKVLLAANLAHSYVTANKVDEAIQQLDKARELVTEVADDSVLAEVLGAAANAEQSRGNFDVALSLQEEALLATDRAFGRSHPSYGALLDNIGGILVDLGRAEEALTYHRRAIAILTAQGEDYPPYQAALSNLAASLANIGRLEEAAATFEQVAQVYDRTLGPDHFHTAILRINLAGVYGRLERHSEAEQHAALALPVLEKGLGPTHLFVSYALTNLGLARLLSGQPEAAQEPLRRAVEIQRTQEVPAEHRGEALFGLARALEFGPPARTLAREARAAFIAAGRQEDIERVDAFLAAR